MSTEYEKYRSSPKMKKERAQRNAARAKMVKAGKAKKGDGMHVDHKSSARTQAGLNNADSNLRVMKAKTNRVKQ